MSRKPSAPSPRQKTALAGATILVLLFVLYTYSGAFREKRRPSTNIYHYGTSWRRDTREYVLSPSWDINSPPQKRYYNWTLTEISGNPDGVWRKLLAINSQFPGPLVEVNEGDTLVIDVHNRMTNSTSLHWHGFHQNGTNFMDGTPGITNCPIPPGSSFRYEFTANGLRGTYWYHAHFTTQRVDGLFGPLVVHSPKEKIGVEYASDRVVMVQDYYHDLSAALLPQYLAPNNENAEPVPNGALVNGRNIIDCSKVPKSYQCETSEIGMEVLDLERNGAHRLRFINVGAFAEFDVELDDHDVSLVEVDGVEVNPYNINRFRINVAQRYSVVINTRHSREEDLTYWLRAKMVVHCFAEIPETLEAEVRAVIQYSSYSSSLPRVPETTGWSESPELECKEMDLAEVTMAVSFDPPKTTDTLIYLRSNFEIGSYKLSRGFFNHTSWRPSETPTLMSVISGISSKNTLFTKPNNNVLKDAYDVRRQLVVNIPQGKTVDLLIDNFDDGNHPFHLHGHKFWVLGQGKGYFDANEQGNMKVNGTLRRDTVTIEAFGWVLIRFVADNPGMWAMHCHIAWHVEAGMLMQFLVAPEVVGSWSVPPKVEEHCGQLEKQKGGPMRDEDFYW